MKFIERADPQKPREGWNEKFKKMAQSGDDELLEPIKFDLLSDEEKWKWEDVNMARY